MFTVVYTEHTHAVVCSFTELSSGITSVERRKCSDYVNISQLTLSLYLMTQCQLKLRHSLTSLAETLDYIKVAQRRHSVDRSLDQLTLKLVERKILMYSTMTINN